MPNENATPVVSIGPVDVSSAVVRMHTNHAINEEGTATVFLRLDDPILKTIDYSDVSYVSAEHGGVTHRLFTGAIAAAEIVGDELVIRCENATALKELSIGHLQMQNCAVDIVVALSADAGVAVQIAGFAEPPIEEFAVIASVTGLALDKPAVTVAGVSFSRFSSSTSIDALRGFKLEGEALNEFGEEGVVASASVTAARMYDAESQGLCMVDNALSWLVTRSRYSYGSDPDGGVLTWKREQMRFNPRRGALVCVRGQESGRAWLRNSDLRHGTSPIGNLDHAPLQAFSNEGNALALGSLRRAATATRFQERIAALWEAIEYFTGSYSAPRLFSRGHVKDIRKATTTVLSGELGPAASKRLEELIGSLNNAPLMVRFMAKTAGLGINLAEHETEVLKTLRNTRNDTHHGRAATDPGKDAIDRGVAVVSRILVAASANELDQAARQVD